jgi:hypothetical protein
MKTH